MNDEWKKDRVGAAQRGENPMVLARMPSGYACIGDTQFLPGYCVLNSDSRADHLSDLPLKERTQFLIDMSVLGEAIMQACAPLRVNYSIYGNTDHYVHAHVTPRYAWEDDSAVKLPHWRYPLDSWSRPDLAYSDAQHGELRERIRAALVELMAANPS
ncbi:HIT family protein [Deinococcus ruber]|uniref:DeoR family transcriptional regulator n=1 Tax=Deinococcus ruber TaxID=1848197 RepID=A0A918BY92_9DEIO|nr:hypothetical protein [Deinococcus ruber]GGQ96784.1 DeoR family transcriptional regulator [Deinococcus ruber]